MQKQNGSYLTIWGDTVDFKQLLFGLVMGAVLGYVSFVGGLSYLKASHASISKGLMMGYALLFGVSGCVIAGVIGAKLFKPKRIFHDEDFYIDKHVVLRELNIDLKQEAEYLKSVPPEVIAEMHKLQLYHLFSEEAQYREGKK